MTPCQILVVEDDAAIRQTIAECLEFEGYSVRQAASGSDALAEIQRNGIPSVIFLDMVMPLMNGQELIGALRGNPRTASVPVVVMTAAIPALATDTGADALLPKPFELASLLELAERFCGPPRRQGAPA